MRWRRASAAGLFALLVELSSSAADLYKAVATPIKAPDCITDPAQSFFADTDQRVLARARPCRAAAITSSSGIWATTLLPHPLTMTSATSPTLIRRRSFAVWPSPA